MATKPHWTAERIKAAVRDKGISLAALAHRHNLHESTLQKGLRRYQPEGWQVISNFLETPQCELWPEWFDVSGSLKPNPHSIKRAPAGHRQRKRAA